MTTKIVFAMLWALEAQLRACADAIRVLRMVVDEPSSDTSESSCPHPPAARVSVKVMGHPTRFQCRQCGKTLEIINGEVTEIAG